MMFATRGAYKAVRAAQTAALIAWSTVANGDRLGGLVFSEREQFELRPRLGYRAALRLFRVLTESSFWEPVDEGGQELERQRSLLRLTRVARPGSQIFLLSDFRALAEPFERHLRQLARHSDVSLVQFFDPVEPDCPHREVTGSTWVGDLLPSTPSGLALVRPIVNVSRLCGRRWRTCAASQVSN
ncbi:MAG: hypothetical protein CM1200mP36_06310 [Gammaproteobacteria bacterium]|nr:MAG: hypothetical protein CM1200mP36_06310 [Gammaproteobacteria bacterium]